MSSCNLSCLSYEHLISAPSEVLVPQRGLISSLRQRPGKLSQTSIYIALKDLLFAAVQRPNARGRVILLCRYSRVQCYIFPCVRSWTVWLAETPKPKSMERDSKKMRSFRGCRRCKIAKRRCSEEKPSCALCKRTGRTCEVRHSPSFFNWTANA